MGVSEQQQREKLDNWYECVVRVCRVLLDVSLYGMCSVCAYYYKCCCCFNKCVNYVVLYLYCFALVVSDHELRRHYAVSMIAAACVSLARKLCGLDADNLTPSISRELNSGRFDLNNWNECLARLSR